MGKELQGVHKRYRMERVDPATLNHYLCYYCGKTLSDRIEYQQHMLKVHEVMSQSYQLWSDHTMDTLGLRWSETKVPLGEVEEEEENSVSPKSKAKDSDDDDEDYVYEEFEKSSRKRRNGEGAAKGRGKKVAVEKKRCEDLKKKEAEVKRRRRSEDKRKEERARLREEEARKMEAAKQAYEAKKEQEKANALLNDPGYQEEERHSEIKEVERKRKRRPEGSRKKEQAPEQDEPEVSALVKKILEESKKKEASSQEVEITEVAEFERNRKPLETKARTAKYCKVCKKGTHFTFAPLFQHYIEHHHATIQSFHYYGFTDDQLIGKKLLLERDYCQRCIIRFPTSNDYYLHMVQNHIYESVRCQLDFESATNADVEVIFLFRERKIACGYNFKFEQGAEEPEPLRSESVAPPSRCPDVHSPQEFRAKSALPQIGFKVPISAVKIRTEPADNASPMAVKQVKKEIKEEPKDDLPSDQQPSTSTAP
ncbi:unnamed protein product [Caenorhabditis sp. 36 PRJEB53466]|nr:unnamed protein product [Caenorhabditis sp. 36 PRJEB53466]